MLIKVCGLVRQTDADAVAAIGADFCGFIFHAASPRNIAPEAAARLDTGPLRRVGVFVQQDAAAIHAIARTARLDMVQLHGDQRAACARTFRPDQVIRVLWPARYADLAALEADMDRHAPDCALFLLDAGRAGGGSGLPLPWASLGALRGPRPWLLSGGLAPDNLRRALTLCRPAGVDLNSGVEAAPGHKNTDKLKAALAALKGY